MAGNNDRGLAFPPSVEVGAAQQTYSHQYHNHLETKNIYFTLIYYTTYILCIYIYIIVARVKR